MAEPVDFTFDDEINVRIAGKTYLLRLDFSSLLHARIQRWFSAQNADSADEEAIEAEGVELVMRALKVDRQVAQAFKPMERKQLLAFLSVGPYPASEKAATK